MLSGDTVTVSPAFLIASLLLAVTPGPGVFYVVTRSAAQGRAAGLASVAGVACGNLGNAIAASLGLATLFAISAVAFTVVKYAGAVSLGVVFVLIAAATDSIYALLAGSIREILASTALPARTGRLVSGSAFIALGLFTAFSDRRHT
jgi:threonine/homoserine/homoserine lactone efflux protein